MSREDLTTMYVKYPKGEITLWCDGRSDETGDTSNRKKRKKDGKTSTKRQEKEDEVDDVFMQLKDMVENLIFQGYACGSVQSMETCMMILTTRLICLRFVMEY